MSTKSLIVSIIKCNNWLKNKNALIIVLIGVSVINLSIYSFVSKTSFSSSQSRKDASGLTHSLAKKFTYFHYYTGNFPLATTNSKLSYSQRGAESEIKHNGTNLIMEFYHWSRLGESARITAYLPNAWLKGSPETPSVTLFNVIIFIISLLMLFLGFWLCKKPFLGLLLVTLINTTPFFLFEIFANENIFGLLGSTFFLVLGINLTMILSKKARIFESIVLSIVTGVIIGWFSEFRNEVSIVILSAILIYIFSHFKKVTTKLVLVVICVFSFLSIKKIIRNHFNTKFEETAVLVGANGGHVYNGAKISGHNVWHPLFCGLGDFDTKYGYEWNDLRAYEYAIPILNNTYNMGLKYKPGQYHIDQYYDDDKKYYVKPEELKNYEEVMKHKVLSDIKKDPIWYVDIIVKRIIRVFTRTLPFSYLGFIMIPLLYFLLKTQKWYWLKLLIVSLPLSATSIIIYSGRGSTNNSVFGYFIVVIIAYELFSFFRKHELNP